MDGEGKISIRRMGSEIFLSGYADRGITVKAGKPETRTIDPPVPETYGHCLPSHTDQAIMIMVVSVHDSEEQRGNKTGGLHGTGSRRRQLGR